MKKIIVLFVAFISLCSCRVENKGPIISNIKDTSEKKINKDSSKSEYEGWTKYEIDGFGVIIIPPEMEVQKGKYKELGEKFRKMNGLDSPQIVFQQSGLNDDKSDAKSSYARIILKTIIEKPGNFERLGSLYASKSELEEASTIMKSKLEISLKSQGMDLEKWYPLEIKKINNANALFTSYERKSKNNPSNVKVRMYQFQNYDREHIVTFSYRISEKEKWSSLYDKIVSSIKITEIK